MNIASPRVPSRQIGELEASHLYARFLLADLRGFQTGTKQFDPNQPRDSHGRWTRGRRGGNPTSDPNSQGNASSTGASSADNGSGSISAPDSPSTAFSPDKPGWHDYTAGPDLVCSAAQRCSKQEMADYLSRFAVPGQDPAIPVVNKGHYDVFAPETKINVGTVQTTISDDGLTVTNQTMPGHIFYDGQIVRTASQAKDGSWFVTTHGTGNNTIFGMDWVNQETGPSIFQTLDAQMRNDIGAHHAATKSHPFGSSSGHSRRSDTAGLDPCSQISISRGAYNAI